VKYVSQRNTSTVFVDFTSVSVDYISSVNSASRGIDLEVTVCTEYRVVCNSVDIC